MALYSIGYDLIKPEKNYPKLIEYLQQVGAKRVLLSEWMLKSNESRDAIFNAVKAHIDEDDKLMVCDVSSAIGTGNLLHPLSNL